MTTAEMVDLCKQRTKVSDDTKILRELNSAYEWAVTEVFKSADGPQLLVKVGEEITALVATTRDYDLEAALTGGTLLGLTNLWAKLTTNSEFIRLVPVDVSSDEFVACDSSTIANPLIAYNLPIYYAVVNYGRVRFAPALPSGTVLRADYSKFGPVPDPTTNSTQDDGTDLPRMFHNAIVAKTVAHLFNTLDDSRESGWETRAIQFLNSAIYAAGKTVRTQAPVTTRPFRRTNRERWI